MNECKNILYNKRVYINVYRILSWIKMSSTFELLETLDHTKVIFVLTRN